MRFQVIFYEGQRQRGVSDHDGPTGGDGVRHRCPQTAALRPDRQKPGEQKPSQTAAQEVRETWRDRKTHRETRRMREAVGIPKK